MSVGTLETLLRAKPGAVLPQEPAGGGVDTASSAAVGDFTARVGALETQIGALSSQNRVPPIDRGLPQDPLASSAQYWIGESYYVRGQYKNAADAFLKG